MIQIEQVHHHFKLGKRSKEREVTVLCDINLQIAKGEIVALVGRSGSGKSTLLHIVGGFLRPSSGSIRIAGQDVTSFNESQWADFRRQQLGFVFQSFQLIPSMTAWDNASLPLVLQGTSQAVREKRVRALFERLDIGAIADHYPGELSGGQQQRVGIARALALDPPILLMDEPTGSLDSENEAGFLQLLRELNRERGLTQFIITHDAQVASIGDRVLRMEDGTITAQTAQEAGIRE